MKTVAKPRPSRRRAARLAALAALAGAGMGLGLGLASCGSNTAFPLGVGIGPSPLLPAPATSLVPTMAIAVAEGWAEGATPTPAQGLAVAPFATGLDHPRWLLVLPNGDVLVAESNAQPPEDPSAGGLRALAERKFMALAGAGVPSADRITLLRDQDGDGTAETRAPLLTGLTSPFGMAWANGTLYVANTDGLVAVPFTPGDLAPSGPARTIAPLPRNPPNRHWTKGLALSGDGTRAYVSIGSNSDHGENGMEAEEGRARIVEIDLATGASRPFATGIRNPVGMGWEPKTGVLWAVVNERDELGGDLVPDYLTSVNEGDYFGWPWVYYGAHPDPRVETPAPDRAARVPDYALGSHVAPLGLTFATGAKLGAGYAEGAFVGEHGSWNRVPRSGYEVVFVPFKDGRPVGVPSVVLSGFLADGKALGRPVGVAIDGSGALLVADDVGDAIWRVTQAR